MSAPACPLGPDATIGILGGGQLGRTLALAAARLGFKCRVFCPAPASPAFDVVRRVTEADYLDKSALDRRNPGPAPQGGGRMADRPVWHRTPEDGLDVAAGLLAMPPLWTLRDVSAKPRPRWSERDRDLRSGGLRSIQTDPFERSARAGSRS